MFKGKKNLFDDGDDCHFWKIIFYEYFSRPRFLLSWQTTFFLSGFCASSKRLEERKDQGGEE